MDIRKVKKLIELLEASSVDEIEIKEGEESVRISLPFVFSFKKYIPSTTWCLCFNSFISNHMFSNTRCSLSL